MKTTIRRTWTAVIAAALASGAAVLPWPASPGDAQTPEICGATAMPLPSPVAPALPKGAPPDGAYAAIAQAKGTAALADSEATGGAVYVANGAAPFAEASVRSGPANEAVGAVVYDRNAVSGVYSIASSTSQTSGGPALCPLANTATSRYPEPPAHAEPSADITSDPLRIRAGAANASTVEGAAQTEAHAASVEVKGVLFAGAHVASATARAVGGTVVSEALSHVQDLSIAGLVRIEDVYGESRGTIKGSTAAATTVFRVTGVTVAGIPVTIGSDGIRAADGGDPGLPSVIAGANKQVNEALASAGITLAVLQPVTSQLAGAHAATPGLMVTIKPQGTPPGTGGTIVLTIGSTSVDVSFEPSLPFVAPPLPSFVPPEQRSITTTTYGGGDQVVSSGSVSEPPAPVSYVRRLPPVVALFGLWQLSTFGWVGLAWWRRSAGARPAPPWRRGAPQGDAL